MSAPCCARSPRAAIRRSSPSALSIRPAAAAVRGAAAAIEARQSDRGRSGGDALLALARAASASRATTCGASSRGVRLFEIASRFRARTVSAIGSRKCSQAWRWAHVCPSSGASRATPVDFFDVKGDLEALLALGGGRRGVFVRAGRAWAACTRVAAREFCATATRLGRSASCTRAWCASSI